MTTSPDVTAQVFHRDLDNMNDELHRLDAVVTEPDGFQWIDSTKVPESFLDTYNGLVSAGYARGFL